MDACPPVGPDERPLRGAAPPAILRAEHRRRLRRMWRSAGWPCQDMVELELLAAGLLERLRDGHGRETLRVTDAGVAMLAATLNGNRASRAAHEALADRVALQMQRAGRIAWRGLALRAPLPVDSSDGGVGGEAGGTRWVVAMPDVYSIRHTTREDWVEPVAHEVKVRRADLLADLRRPDKAAAYRALASQCWYVIRAGIADPDEIPGAYGVMLAHGSDEAATFEVARPAPPRAMTLPFAVWMALARSAAWAAPDDDDAPWLG